MTTKLCILRSPLQVKLADVGSVLMTIGHLHNFVISERSNAIASNTIDPLCVGRGGDPGYLPSHFTVIQEPGTRHSCDNADVVNQQQTQVD